MPGSGLIAIEKIVERLGKAHKQRYWVKPSELREMVRKGNAEKAVDRAGGNAASAGAMVRGWRSSAGSKQTAGMRGAVARVVFASKPALVQRELARSVRAASNVVSTGELSDVDPAEQVRGVTNAFRNGLENDETRRNIAALAAVAQSMYDKPTVTLWRGIRGNSTLANLYDEAYEAIQKDPDATIEIETGTLTSFTESSTIADTFAKLSSGHGEENAGFYFKVDVPRESIVMSHRVKDLNPGLPPEKEVAVITSGSIRIKARDIMAAGDPPGRGLKLLAGKAPKETAPRDRKKTSVAGQYKSAVSMTPAEYAKKYLGG